MFDLHQKKICFHLDLTNEHKSVCEIMVIHPGSNNACKLCTTTYKW